ncbi:MAG: hypothetical protein LBR22_10435 [Desulfovibrio sp.]|jgi:uncharacterized membrane protein|nr:hypothetical protein [Desulfovibrio sp.]
MTPGLRAKYITYMKIFYLLLVLFPIATIICDYMLRKEFNEDSVLKSHCAYQINTCWAIFAVWIIFMFCGGILAFMLGALGSGLLSLLYLAMGAWVIYRAVKGYLALDKNLTIKPQLL